MAPKKLSDADRQDILQRYRQPEENTVTIANSYGVSTSTISRILKQNLSEAEYEALIQQKRSGNYKSSAEQVDLPGMSPQLESPVPAIPVSPDPVPSVPEIVSHQPAESKPVIPPPRRRQRRRGDDSFAAEELSVEPEAAQLELTVNSSKDYEAADDRPVEPFASNMPVKNVPVLKKTELEEIEAELGKVRLDTDVALEEALDDDDLDEEEDDDLDDLDDELEEGDLDEEEEELADSEGFTAVQIQRGGFVQVLPLSDATIPKTCYVVVDRSSELITRPLKDFADLGQIPEAETQEKTLPIFDNHRIAKRFTRRMQRVVKVPDGRMFHKVRPYLHAKGITRLLIDGQVYSL